MLKDQNQSQLLQGIIVHGKQLGRQLGYPTANLCIDNLQGTLPSAGVYAAWATLEDGRQYRAMVNIGYRPTVDTVQHRLSVEAHLDGFSGDLYGQYLSLTIISLIREERRMDSLEQLKEQLAKDLLSTRQLTEHP